MSESSFTRGRGGYRGGRGGNQSFGIKSQPTGPISGGTITKVKLDSNSENSKISEVIMAQAAVKKKQFKRKYIDQPDVEGHSYDIKTFRNFIIQLLTSRGNLTPFEADRYTDEQGMIEFIRATTHNSWNHQDPRDNYEIYEHLGDTTVNKSTTWYLSRRFPDIIARGQDGVVILTRQKNLVTSKPFLAKYCGDIGLNKFIRWKPLLYVESKDENIQARGGQTPVSQRITLDRSMREDTFEAFFGCLENIIDIKEEMIGIGAAVCYKILASIYDQENIPTSKRDLFDPKTQLKEIIDKRRREGWSIQYPVDLQNPHLVGASLQLVDANGDKQVIEFGQRSTLLEEEDSDAETVKRMIEQLLSLDVLKYLKTNYNIERFSETD